MSFTQCWVQLSSSVAPWTPRVVIHSCERALEWTLKAHWLSIMEPRRLTVSLGLSLANKLKDNSASAARKNAARILYIDLFIGNLLKCSVLLGSRRERVQSQQNYYGKTTNFIRMASCSSLQMTVHNTS